ncbi:uncharacterized protein HKW66_Vig0042420 [Vigna angularis]|uniref:Uncharacterized protein n=1 Tax=Phaseolus angularis TaxID=3914 RepID=A0A8T0KYE8_PHAAN|nr:uncharacterized protein HKW66_Vig0042420 [Vigna angularis]
MASVLNNRGHKCSMASPPSEPSTPVDEAVAGPSDSALKGEDDSVNEDDGWVLVIEKALLLVTMELVEEEGAVAAVDVEEEVAVAVVDVVVDVVVEELQCRSKIAGIIGGIHVPLS